jgi:divalent metal cation (Fe/Co/Zn/Cd) transporter
MPTLRLSCQSGIVPVFIGYQAGLRFEGSAGVPERADNRGNNSISLIMSEASRGGIRSAQVAILINTGLAITKLVAGIVGHTYALVADAVESTADIFSSTIVWGGLSVASRDPDEGHPFGYGKAESLASAVVSLMLLAAAVGIALEAISEIRTPHLTPAPWTLVVLVGVVVVKWTLSRRVHTVAPPSGARRSRRTPGTT